MTRTNVDIDDELIARVMKKFGLKTKREAVDFALRQVAGPESVREALLGLEGIGWDGDLDEIRNNPVTEW